MVGCPSDPNVIPVFPSTRNVGVLEPPPACIVPRSTVRAPSSTLGDDALEVRASNVVVPMYAAVRASSATRAQSRALASSLGVPSRRDCSAASPATSFVCRSIAHDQASHQEPTPDPCFEACLHCGRARLSQPYVLGQQGTPTYSSPFNFAPSQPSHRAVPFPQGPRPKPARRLSLRRRTSGRLAFAVLGTRALRCTSRPVIWRGNVRRAAFGSGRNLSPRHH
ncbi:hypothetical protein OH76DRAFT_22290 [Lentinus brumalis]|uniref:Uncharacterized protein n=1 Tax=Lentinus brumalis TaxID=2498619 RepID=A0A371DXI4_9APHY|nr:hypothetical protein OH76DRAFT_22290 [Polyporus brumalis]